MILPVYQRIALHTLTSSSDANHLDIRGVGNSEKIYPLPRISAHSTLLLLLVRKYDTDE